MKVLIVCSGNVENYSMLKHHPYIYEQIESLKRSFNIEFDIFLVIGKGITGYLSNYTNMKNKIKNFSPDIVHAHYSLSGLLASLQLNESVIITFHGSDGNLLKIRPFSMIAAKLSDYNIFVSDKIREKININNKNAVVPCGINFDVFYPIEMKKAREKLNIEPGKEYILFTSRFTNTVKNAPLALSAVEKLHVDIELLELTNKSRKEVNLLLNACNLLLLTSISEGSPQIIKEAMACNCPIVATDVGDIREMISNTEGCFLTSFEPDDVAAKINLALNFNKRTNGRETIKHLDNNIIAKKIFDIYQTVIYYKS